jgi:hypothetical protein
MRKRPSPSAARLAVRAAIASPNSASLTELEVASVLQASSFLSDVIVFRLNARPPPKTGSEPAFRRNEAEHVYTIEAAHNPEVAGSNPAPATTKGAGNGAFRLLSEQCGCHNLRFSVEAAPGAARMLPPRYRCYLRYGVTGCVPQSPPPSSRSGVFVTWKRPLPSGLTV